MLKYTFRDFAPFKGAAKADPQAIGEALGLLAETAGGELTPQAVVDAAKDEASVLHPHFEWNDAKAAAAHRLDQARTIIRALVCEDEESDDAPSHAFLSISASSGTSYRPLSAVRKSRELQAIVLRQAERDLEAFEKRYREFVDICELVHEAREMTAQKRNANESHAEARA